MRRLPVVVVLGVLVGLLALHAAPAYACSCQAGADVADALAESDGAFVGILIGRDDPPASGPLVSSGRPVTNHFEVVRSVKGELGQRVDVEAAASGVSCGLEVEVGERTGLLLKRTETGWRSSLCSQTEPAGLLAFAPGSPPAPEPSERGFFVAAGVLALAVAAFFVVQCVRRRES